MEKKFKVGSELSGGQKHISFETMRRYSGETGIHAQDDAGKDLGLGGALVQGGQLVAYLNQFMMSHFGEGYLKGGDIAVSFIKPARPGDILTSKGVVKEIKSEGENSIVLCDVWLENQNGEKVTVGASSALIRK
jgi:acyl dehydratase